MTRYYIVPHGMPKYSSFSVEVSKDVFDALCVELLDENIHVSTEIEEFQETNIERWYLDYLEDGKQTIPKQFGFTLTPLDEDL